MRLLLLDPFHAGSHAAFADGWARHSRHAFATLTLPGRHWTWRMRGAAVAFADRLAAGAPPGPFDAVVCTDMLDLAAFRGLAPPAVARLPSVVYFHENQLTYPSRAGDGSGRAARDRHFAFTNLTTALAADAVWFNSAFHRDALLAAVGEFLPRLPDHRPRDVAGRVAAKSAVMHPGIEPLGRRDGLRRPGPLRVAWVGRWEHDKRPDRFADALRRLAARGVDFRLTVLGERYRTAPPAFAAMGREFADRLDHRGYAESRDDYAAALRHADAVVSTADHEFFGLAVAEAASAGCVPVLPRSLAYPEVWGDAAAYHDATPAGVAAVLAGLSAELDTPAWETRVRTAVERAERYAWPVRAAVLDGGISRLVP